MSYPDTWPEKCPYCGEIHHPSHVNATCKMLAQIDADGAALMVELDHADAEESERLESYREARAFFREEHRR